MKLRLASSGRRHLVLTALLLLLVPASAVGSRRPGFHGQVLDPPRPALDFTLTDQSNRPVQLASLHGQVVVLTFLYTTCVDVCPLVAAKLHEVTDLLGSRRAEVAVVAVTVDPERDTPAAMTEFSKRWAMLDRWRFLTGTERQLETIWQYYWAGHVRREIPGATATAKPSHAIGHGSPVHVFDRAGRIRVVYDADFKPADLTHDIEALLEQ
jgi:protein SCO1